MQTTKKILAGICVSLMTTLSYAYDNSKLTLTIINHSKETLSHFATTMPDSKNTLFTISPTTIAPGATMTVVGTINGLGDLVGNLHFKSDMNKDNVFMIVDKRLMNNGQPTFALDSRKINLKSNVLSSTFNKDGRPKEVSYTAATVEIVTK